MTDKKEPSIKDIFAEIYSSMAGEKREERVLIDRDPNEAIDVKATIGEAVTKGIVSIDTLSSRELGGAAFIVCVPSFVPFDAVKIMSKKLKELFQENREWIQVTEKFFDEVMAVNDKLAAAQEIIRANNIGGTISKAEPANDTGGPAVS